MWGNFKEMCSIQFGPPTCNNPLGELNWQHQTTTVEDYQDRFLALLCWLIRYWRSMRCNFFMAGHMNDIRVYVEIQNSGHVGRHESDSHI